MKRLLLTTAILCGVSLPLLAQTQTAPVVVGPVELRNPHRLGGWGNVQNGSTPQVTPTPVQATITESPLPVMMYAEGRYLFVLRGDSLFQFDKKTLKLLRAVQLPHAPDPTLSTTDSTDEIKSFTSPSLRPAPSTPVKP